MAKRQLTKARNGKSPATKSAATAPAATRKPKTRKPKVASRSPEKLREVTHREWLIGVARHPSAKAVSEPTVHKVMYEVLTDTRLREIPAHYEEVSVLFTNDDTIHALNREYRGKDKATDVLSFASEDDISSLITPSLGDVVISIETAARQARKFGWSLGAEVLRLLIHGTLHLCGYDHEKVTKAEATKMRTLEKQIHTTLRHFEKSLV